MEAVGIEFLLYGDTDSIMYVQKRNQPLRLPTGNYLGELTNETELGWEIRKFVGLGPKNYSFKEKELRDEETFRHTCKIRGITLNTRARKVIDFDHFYNLVKAKYEKKIVSNPNTIRRLPGYRIVSRPEHKTHQIVNNKRKLKDSNDKDDFRTLPYGFKRRKT